MGNLNILSQLQQQLPSDQINQRFASLGQSLEGVPAAPTQSFLVPGGYASGSAAWSASSARSSVMTLFPVECAVEITSCLDRLASSPMVHPPRWPPGRPGPFGDDPLARETERGFAPGRAGVLRNIDTTGSSSPDRDDEQGIFPWALLADPVMIPLLGPDIMASLGAEPDMGGDRLVQHIGVTHPGAPVAQLAAATDALAMMTAVASLGVADAPNMQGLSKVGTKTDTDHDTDTHHTPGIVLSDAAQKLLADLVEGFKTAEFRGYWWGYKVGFDRKWCDAFIAGILGAEGPLLLKALTAAIGAAGFLAALGAAATAVGGVLIAALLLYGLYLAAAVKFNEGSGGAWICGIWETLIPLWAVGR